MAEGGQSLVALCVTEQRTWSSRGICPSSGERWVRGTFRLRVGCAGRAANIPGPWSSLRLAASSPADPPQGPELGWHPHVPDPGLAASLNVALGRRGMLCGFGHGLGVPGNCASSGTQCSAPARGTGGAREHHLLMKQAGGEKAAGVTLCFEEP